MGGFSYCRLCLEIFFSLLPLKVFLGLYITIALYKYPLFRLTLLQPILYFLKYPSGSLSLLIFPLGSIVSGLQDGTRWALAGSATMMGEAQGEQGRGVNERLYSRWYPKRVYMYKFRVSFLGEVDEMM